MSCKYCSERGKTWNGDDPKCAFEGKVFNKDNWNCAAMNKLRSIAEDNTVVLRDSDENIGIIPYDGVFLVITWYKNRGRCGNAKIMQDEEESVLTYDLAKEIIDYYNNMK